jgi:hypothetical protein
MIPLVHAPFDLINILYDRMTGEQELDAFSSCYGDRGTGKSEAQVYLAERLAIKLGKKFHKPPEEFFTIDNVRSVDQQGTMKMFQGEQFKKKKHQIFIADDVSITSNARNFQTPENKRLNAILTVSRIYRHCVFINTLYPELIDNVLRNFANIACVAVGPDMNPHSPTYRVNRLRVYAMSRSTAPAQKNRQTFNKYYQFYDKEHDQMNRIVAMRVREPTEAILEKYKALRKDKTDAYITEIFGPDEDEEGVPIVPKVNKNLKKFQDADEKWGVLIRRLVDENNGRVPVTQIRRETKLSREMIDKIVGNR